MSWESLKRRLLYLFYMNLAQHLHLCPHHSSPQQFVLVQNQQGQLVCGQCLRTGRFISPGPISICLNGNSALLFLEWTKTIIEVVDEACRKILETSSLDSLLFFVGKALQLQSVVNKKQLKERILGAVDQQLTVYEGNIRFVSEAKSLQDLNNPLFLGDLHNIFVDSIQKDLSMMKKGIANNIHPQFESLQLDELLGQIQFTGDLLTRLQEKKNGLMSAIAIQTIEFPPPIDEKREEDGEQTNKEGELSINTKKSEKMDQLPTITDEDNGQDDSNDKKGHDKSFTPTKDSFDKVGETWQQFTIRIKNQQSEQPESTHKKHERGQSDEIDDSEQQEQFRTIIQRLEDENSHLKKMKQEMETEMQSLTDKIERVADGSLIADFDDYEAEVQNLRKQNIQMKEKLEQEQEQKAEIIKQNLLVVDQNIYLDNRLRTMDEECEFLRMRLEEWNRDLLAKEEEAALLKEECQKWQALSSNEQTGSINKLLEEKDTKIKQLQMEIERMLKENASANRINDDLVHENRSLKIRLEEFSQMERDNENLIEQLQKQIKNKVGNITKIIQRQTGEDKNHHRHEEELRLQRENSQLLQQIHLLQNERDFLQNQQINGQIQNKQLKGIITELEDKLSELDRTSGEWIKELQFQLKIKEEQLSMLERQKKASEQLYKDKISSFEKNKIGVSEQILQEYQKKIQMLEHSLSNQTGQVDYDEDLMREVIELEADLKGRENDLITMHRIFEEVIEQQTEEKKAEIRNQLAQDVRFFRIK